MGIVDGNCRVEIYIHWLDLTGYSCKKCNFRSLARIEPAALRFRCSALTNWATEVSCMSSSGLCSSVRATLHTTTLQDSHKREFRYFSLYIVTFWRKSWALNPGYPPQKKIFPPLTWSKTYLHTWLLSLDIS